MNIIKDIAASSAVEWGTIAEKIDENFSEVEDSVASAGISKDISDAILDCFANVAWIDENGMNRYNALKGLLFPIVSITAEFTQGNKTIFEDQGLEVLKKTLTVTAVYKDGTTMTVDEYTLSGEMTAGVSTITVSYEGKSATFDVNVTSFTLPEGCERYDFIEKKTTNNTRVNYTNFIYLKAYEDINLLSMEADLGRKPSISSLDGAGYMGARLASGGSYPFYGVYWQNDTTTHYILNVMLRGVMRTTNIPVSTTRVKLEIKNPEVSPFTVNVNGIVSETEWTSSPTIPYGMCLFNNIPNGNTSTFYINTNARIGDIIFRKADGECVGYYTPVLYNGVIGMYDQISKALYATSNANATTVSSSSCYYAVGNW